jgi:DNA polymerase III gamma/tau subunit
MVTEFYKKYRPRKFKDVKGADATIPILKQMVRKGAVPHTILFHGPSGCGKTTLARILRRKLKCHDMDWNEVNSSNFRGIQSVRDINRIMNLAPVGKSRIWLFDECHKWTNDAQNAALKMLEDTPEHVYFFLGTTEPNKLIKAIRTRCTEFSVRLLNDNELEEVVQTVVDKEDFTITDEDMSELITASQGSARTILVLLEAISHLDEKERSKAIQRAVEENTEGIELCRAIMNDKTPWKKITTILKGLTAEPESIRWNVLGYARSILLSGKNIPQAYFVIQAFSEPFYNTKMAGLVAACYEVRFSGEA